MTQRDEVAGYLARLREGDRSALEDLLPHIYEDLRGLARGLFRDVPDGYSLQPTALVHEAYLRLAGTKSQEWEDRKHFLDVAAMAMRQLLRDHGRRRRAKKRGGGAERVALEGVALEEAAVGNDTPQRAALNRAAGHRETGNHGVDLLALDEALTELERLDARQARIVELRIFSGMTIEETADLLDVSPRTVQNDWKMARVFLTKRVGEGSES